MILEDGNGKPQGWVQQPHILNEVIPILDCIGGKRRTSCSQYRFAGLSLQLPCGTASNYLRRLPRVSLLITLRASFSGTFIQTLPELVCYKSVYLYGFTAWACLFRTEYRVTIRDGCHESVYLNGSTGLSLPLPYGIPSNYSRWLLQVSLPVWVYGLSLPLPYGIPSNYSRRLPRASTHINMGHVCLAEKKSSVSIQTNLVLFVLTKTTWAVINEMPNIYLSFCYKLYCHFSTKVFFFFFPPR